MLEIPPLSADSRLSTADLRELGLSERRIATLVRDGLLVRVRVGSFARADSHPHALQALRVGGRIACVSELALRGVFVHGGAGDLVGERARVHVQLEANASRLGLRSDKRRTLRLHWVTLRRGLTRNRRPSTSSMPWCRVRHASHRGPSSPRSTPPSTSACCIPPMSMTYSRRFPAGSGGCGVSWTAVQSRARRPSSG
jgi:hypothetical protein